MACIVAPIRMAGGFSSGGRDISRHPPPGRRPSPSQGTDPAPGRTAPPVAVTHPAALPPAARQRDSSEKSVQK